MDYLCYWFLIQNFVWAVIHSIFESWVVYWIIHEWINSKGKLKSKGNKLSEVTDRTIRPRKNCTFLFHSSIFIPRSLFLKWYHHLYYLLFVFMITWLNLILSLKLFIFSWNDSPWKTKKIAFYFIWKAASVLEIFKSL